MTVSRRTFLAGSMSAIAVGVAGCSSSGSPSSGSSRGAAGTGSAVSRADVKGDLLVWDFASPDLAKVDDAAFKALYPNVNLKHVDQPSKNYATLLQAALSAGKGPDVFYLHTSAGELTSFVPALLDISDRITADQKKYLRGLPAMSPNGDSSKGIYGLPFQNNGLQFYFNKKLFSQANLDPTKPPTSWPALLDACAKLKAAGITPISAGDGEQLQATQWFGVIAPMVLTISQTVAMASGSLKYNSPQGKQIFQMYLDLAHGGNFEKSWRSDGIFTQQPDNFASGKTAMTMTLSNYVGVFAAPLKDDLGVFKNPGLTDSQHAHYLPYGPGQGICVSKRSGNPDAAFAWASFKTSVASQRKDVDALSTANKLQRGALPTDSRVKPGPGAIPAVKQMVAALQSNPTHQPPASSKPAVSTAMIQNSGALVDGRMSLDKFLDALDQAQAG